MLASIGRLRRSQSSAQNAIPAQLAVAKSGACPDSMMEVTVTRVSSGSWGIPAARVVLTRAIASALGMSRGILLYEALLAVPPQLRVTRYALSRAIPPHAFLRARTPHILITADS